MIPTMTMSSLCVEFLIAWPRERATSIWQTLKKETMWRRMIKLVLGSTTANAIMLIPKVESVIGRAAYLAGIVSALGHPARRLGQEVEILVLVAIGTLLASGWSILGIYLSSLIIDTNPPAAYTIRATFLVISFLLHGFFRSHAPRIFLGTVIFIIVSVVTMISTTKFVALALFTQVAYPIGCSIGLMLSINLLVFPEFSSSYLGATVLDSLENLSNALRASGDYFILQNNSSMKSNNQASVGSMDSARPLRIGLVTSLKAGLRQKLASCKAAQDECIFELAYSVLPPEDLKAISTSTLTRLTMNAVAVIGACESKFALMGDENDLEKHITNVTSARSHDDTSVSEKSVQSRLKDDIELVKPRREIESGDPELLKHYIAQIATPYKDLRQVLERTLDVIMASIAYTYRVPKLPSGIKTPAGIEVEEIDLHLETMRRAIETFDHDIRASLETHGMWKQIREDWPDVMPREEIFLISSFYLNVRQAALHIKDILQHCRLLVDEFSQRKGWRRLYAPKIEWRRWLSTGGEDMDGHEGVEVPSTLQAIRRETSREIGAGNLMADREGSRARKNVVFDEKMNDLSANKVHRARDSQRLSSNTSRPTPNLFPCVREHVANAVEAVQYSEDVQYAFKITFAAFLTLWPAFVPKWNAWYGQNRGLWAALQLVLITEPTFGNAIQTFILRAFGTTLGCLWGWAAYEAGNGNRYVCGVMIGIGVVPAAYVILGSAYIKAGIVTIVSITVVALSSEVQTVPGSATENFLKRFIAFNIGAFVAIVVQFTILPVKARMRMVEALANTLRHLSEMENCTAFGIDSHIAPDSTVSHEQLVVPLPTLRRFERATSKARTSLQAAESYMPFTLKEPRLKGSFAGFLLIYKEIAFVLHQIVDRMENMIVLRTAYGSGPLQEYNLKIFRYRRDLAASITICLFAVHEALTARLPLPQFLPSARLAQLRVINRVREVVREDVQLKSMHVSRPASPSTNSTSHHATQRLVESENKTKESNSKHPEDPLLILTRKTAVRQNFLSWNAGAMAQAEIVEYLEELCDLTKLLVGANEFRTGLLFRPTFREHVERLGRFDDAADADGDGGDQEERHDQVHGQGLANAASLDGNAERQTQPPNQNQNQNQHHGKRITQRQSPNILPFSVQDTNPATNTTSHQSNPTTRRRRRATTTAAAGRREMLSPSPPPTSPSPPLLPLPIPIKKKTTNEAAQNLNVTNPVDDDAEDDPLSSFSPAPPYSLRRIQTRKFDAVLKRQRTLG